MADKQPHAEGVGGALEKECKGQRTREDILGFWPALLALLLASELIYPVTAADPFSVTSNSVRRLPTCL